MRHLYLATFCLFALLACNKTDAPQASIDAPSSPPAVQNLSIKDGTYCFTKHFKQDVTDIKLTVTGNIVTGIMNWIPYQKDGARGTLTGTKNATGEMALLYDYVIEGSKQTETKMMKIQDGKLLVKVGELLDPKYDGNLIYKDVSQAKYSETLDSVTCK